jgi:N-alpha-acetyltransferase 15/16, NatA auxiliary subunit
LIGKEGKEKNEMDLLATLSLDSISMNDASAGLELLYEWCSSATVKDKYRNGAAERWNRASLFQAKHT